MTQASQPPTFINLPPPGSQPETPSEMPGTPTSTTTSLSALSTTAIKDGHRGHLPQNPLARGHAHTTSTTSLEAERADRISRLAGLERVSTLRAPPQPPATSTGAASPSPQTTPTSTTGFPANFPANYPAAQSLTPAYFDGNGQPTADTKMSTVGTASATESYGGDGRSRTTAGERDEDGDVLSTGYREAGSVTSAGGAGDPDAMMDEDMERPRSPAGYDDRMSDDGNASLVGFGEGAGSTVSGPIYHRRPLPGAMTAAQQIYSLERSNSGMSAEAARHRERERERDNPPAGTGMTVAAAGGPAGDTSASSASAIQERRDARMLDGVAVDAEGQQEGFADTTMRAAGGVPAQGREAAERILQRLDSGETRASDPLSSSGRHRGDLGKFYFEEGRER